MATTQATVANPVWARAIPTNPTLTALTAPPAGQPSLPPSRAGQALTFLFNTSHQLRVVMRDGTPWFVASDLAKLLGHRDATSMTRSMDDEDRGTHIVCTPSAAQQMTIVNESGLYCAIFASRRPEAKQFKRWVTAEVLPAIRGTGTYAAPLAVSHTAPLPYQPKPEPRPRAINQAEYNALAAIAEKASMCYSLPGVGRHAAWRVAREAAGISKGGIRSMPAASLAAVKARMEEFLAESKKLRDALLVAERALASRFPGVRPAASDEVVWTPERVEAWLSADRAAR